MQDRLIPTWEIGKTFSYRITKSETTTEKFGNPICLESDYQVELKLLDDQIIEAYFPNGILEAMPYFRDLKEWFSQIDNKGINCLFYQVNSAFSAPVLQSETSILKNLKEVEKALLELVQTDEDIESVTTLFGFLYTDKESITRLFLEDIRRIHEYYGIMLLDGEFVDLKQFQDEPSEQPDRMLDSFNLQLGSIDLLQFDVLEDDTFKVEGINGHDNVAGSVRNDFDELEDDFLYGNLDVAIYKSIHLYHHIFIYALQDKLLKQMIYKRHSDGESRRKDEVVSIMLI